jgi:osmotically-inducible protein OsmY
MFRALLRLVLVVVILAAAAAFFMGYRLGGDGVEIPVSANVPTVDTDKARATGAAIGEKVASGTAHAEQILSDSALTAKIKAKMALDDTVKALSIDVDTRGTAVTLTGTVHTEAERTKAVQLARETQGVTTVNDRLVVR